MPNRSTYLSTEAPATPQQGDLRIDQTTSQVLVYSGLRWIALVVPTNAGQPTLAIPDVRNGAVYFDTTRRALTVFNGGSWFTMASMSIA